MSLTTRTIPQLFNGVSRQPAILRAQDQTADELNSWASASSGVGKRPPTEVVARIADSIAAGAYVHLINRDVAERYTVVIEDGSVRVFGFDGIQRTVNAPGGFGYLADGEYAAVTVADYTFIVNRKKTVLMKAVGADTQPPPAYTRDPTRQPSYADGSEEPSMPGDLGGYEPNASIA